MEEFSVRNHWFIVLGAGVPYFAIYPVLILEKAMEKSNLSVSHHTKFNMQKHYFL